LVGKVDLVIWAKNGAASLPEVLPQIDKVIPHENICHKILVDDHSVDQTVKIARDFNWAVYTNPSKGVSDGANEALRHVDRDFFVSIEQDIILSKKWWDIIPSHMEDPSVACAQGIRVPTHPVLRLLEEWQSIVLGKKPPLVSIDNNIFRTKVLRSMGGFPKSCPICTDMILMKRISFETCYKWIIDSSVISLHVRNDLKANIEHQYKMGYLCARTPYCMYEEYPSIGMNLRILLTSPVRALHIALKRKHPNLIWAYPLLRLYQLNIALSWRKATRYPPSKTSTVIESIKKKNEKGRVTR
jgi:glycosyltransferase involved in cell wall biosynthesis